MEQILTDTGALRSGHFLLSSGRHSSQYVQCAQILRFPKQAATILAPVALQVASLKPDLLVGPAMGGILVAYELGRQLEKEAIFSERVNGEMKLRRGFEVSPGAKTVICEDVVTTGKSSLEVRDLLESLGAQVLGIACLIDRSQGFTALPIYSAVQLRLQSDAPEDCPLCRQGMALDTPGSRKLRS